MKVHAHWMSPQRRWEIGVDLRQWLIGGTAGGSMVTANVLCFYLIFTRKAWADQLAAWHARAQRT